MDNKTATVKIWVTKDNFALIQEGSYPKQFDTVQPEELSNYVEMTINMQTLTEWVSKHRASGPQNKTLLFG